MAHLWVAAGMVLLAICAQWQVWADIARIAVRDQESSHILLVPAVFAWVAWVRRRRFRQCEVSGAWAGPLVMLLGVLLSAYGYHRVVQLYWHAGALLTALGAAISVLGLAVFTHFGPAILSLIFLIPVPGMTRLRLAIPLNAYTAQISQQLLELLAVPVERSNNLLSVNGVDVTIAEACNGLRMVFALTLVSFVFAFTTSLRMYVRALIIVASPISGIVFNVIRLVPTLWIYGHASHESAQYFHDISGWGMLAVAFLSLLGIIRLLRWALVPVAPFTLAARS